MKLWGNLKHKVSTLYVSLPFLVFVTKIITAIAPWSPRNQAGSLRQNTHSSITETAHRGGLREPAITTHHSIPGPAPSPSHAQKQT